MEALFNYIKEILELFDKLLKALGINVDWDEVLATKA